MSVRWSPSGSSLLSAGLDGLVVLYPNSALTSTVSSKVHASECPAAFCTPYPCVYIAIDQPSAWRPPFSLALAAVRLTVCDRFLCIAAHALSAVWLSETRFATASNDATIALCDVLTSPAVDGSDSPAKPSISLCRSLTAHTKDVNVLAVRDSPIL